MRDGLRVSAFGLTFLALIAPSAAAQTPGAPAAQVEAALAANGGHAALQQCLRNEPAIERYQWAVRDLANVGDPRQAPPFYCSGIGASWQELAPAACCSAFERDKSRNVDAAFTALQQCGLRDRIAERQPAYLDAATKCLAAAGVGSPAGAQPPPPVDRGDQSDTWRDVPAFDQIRSRILGQNAFAVTGGQEWRVFDNAGRLRRLPGFLADRIQAGYAVLYDRAWLQAALKSFRTNMTADDFVAWMARGAAEGAKQYVWFGDESVGHHLPNASVRTMGGQFCSSEHSTIRGSINGGGDFIYCPLWEQLEVPVGTERLYWGAAEEFLR